MHRGKLFSCPFSLSCLQEIRRVNSLAKRDVWIKQPGDSSGDTKVIMELL